MDDPIPLKKRVEVDNIILVAGMDRIRYPVHRQTLIGSSKYFEAMFGPNFCEGGKKEIVLQHIDGATLQCLIEFCYKGRTTITTDNVEDLIDAAASMEFVRLEQDCCKFLIDYLRVDNCLDALLIADKYNFEELSKKSLKFIRDHFEDVPIADMLEISYTYFTELLKYEDHKIHERIVFDRLVRWIDYDKKERTKYVPSLIVYIRLEHITDKVLLEDVKPFYANYDCLRPHFAFKFQKRLLQPRIPSRLCRYSAKELHFLVPSYNNIQFLKFQANSNQWEKYKKIKTGKNLCFGSVSIDNKIYVIGGISDGLPIRKVILHNLRVDDKKQLPSMPRTRSDFTPIAIGKFIYVFGGMTDACTDMCIRFDTELLVWQSLQSMPYKVRSYHAIALNGKIYVAGGLIANSVYSNRFCCYDTHTNTWTERAPINFEVSGLVLFKWKQSIYAASNDAILRKYDLERDTWTVIGKIRSDQLFHNVMECNDELFAFMRGPKFGRIKIGENEFSVISICDAPFRTGMQCRFFLQ